MKFYFEENRSVDVYGPMKNRHSWNRNISKFDECNSLYVVKMRNIIYKYIYIICYNDI